MDQESEISTIRIDDVKRFVEECAVQAGAHASHAKDLAKLLAAADHRGHFSHGLNRLELYVNDLLSGVMSHDDEPVIEKQTVSTALIDGKNLLGAAVGIFAMKVAIKKAKETGIGMVTVHKSNHYGIAGYYSLMAADEGLMGMAFTNAAPSVHQPRSSEPGIIGTNPISFATPGPEQNRFVLDAATSTVARGKLELARRKGMKLPHGWGTDCDGVETDDPNKVLNGGGLLPLGGADESGGYKGYGLALMVDILCGVVPGANFGKNIRKWGGTDRIADLGHCFIAIDPNAFALGFDGRLDELIGMQRDLHPMNKDQPILVAGDPERIHIEKCKQAGGIPYPKAVIQHMNELADKLSVKHMEVV